MNILDILLCSGVLLFLIVGVIIVVIKTPPDIARLKEQRNIKKLARALRHTDPNIRQAAASALGELQPDNVQSDLILLLKDVEPKVRLAAIQALAAMGGEQTIQAFIAHLKGTENISLDEQILIFSALRNPGPCQCIEFVSAYSQEILQKQAETNPLKIAACEALRDHPNVRVIELLTDQLKDPNVEVRLAAADTLLNFLSKPEIAGTEQIPDKSSLKQAVSTALSAIIQNPQLNITIRSKGLEILAKDQDVLLLDPISSLLNDPQPPLRDRALEILKGAGWQPQPNHPYASYYWFGLEKWDKLLECGKDAVPLLRDFLLRHPDPGADKYKEAAECLLQIHSGTAVFALITRYKQTSAWEDIKALHSLLVKAGLPAVDALMRSVLTSDDKESLLATEILWEIDRNHHPAIEEKFYKAFEDEKNMIFYFKASRRYDELRKNRELVEQFIQLLENRSEADALKAVDLAVKNKMDCHLVIERLVPLLEDGNGHKAVQYAPTMYGGDGREATEEVYTLYPVRVAAQSAIMQLKPGSSVASMAQTAQTTGLYLAEVSE